MAKKPAEDGAEAEGGGKKKKLIMIGGAVAVLLLGGGGYVMKSRSSAAQQAATEAKKPQVAFVDVKEMMVNLASEASQERPRFLKVKVALEVKDPKAVPEMQPLLPRVEDLFQVYLREMRASDLEGSGGIYRLREELLRRVNIALAPNRVDAVLFKEVIIQ